MKQQNFEKILKSMKQKLEIQNWLKNLSRLNLDTIGWLLNPRYKTKNKAHSDRTCY